MHCGLAALALPLLLAGCGAGYLLQATRGQLEVLAERRPIERVIADPATAPELRARLVQLQQAREFASRELGLPDNRSYRSYAELDRPFVVWSVVATPEFSVEPLQWCFPVAGCVAYRGYFRQASAARFAAELAADGHDVTVGGVSAYSTLGRFADPVLSTMLRGAQSDVIGTLFHELAHQVVYVADDTAFNEAFAVTVEQAGLARWFQGAEDSQARQQWQARRTRQQQLVDLLGETRQRLETLYASSASLEVKRASKQQEFASLTRRLQTLQAQWGTAGSLDAWIAAGLNNAHLASIANYWQCVPGFERLLAAVDGDLPAFYREVRQLAARPADERRASLCARPNDQVERRAAAR